MRNSTDIAIITDSPGWHGAQLAHALTIYGFSYQYVSLTDCQICLTAKKPDLMIPGFPNRPPRAVFVRGIPGGTLEQIIFRINILHALTDLQIPVINSPRAIERTVDKPLTSLILSRAGLPTPPTWICEDTDQAMTIWKTHRQKNLSLVIKPIFGSQGVGLKLLDHHTPLTDIKLESGVYYLQQYISPPTDVAIDYRVFVIDGIACAAMERRGQSWITNRAQGATCRSIPISNSLKELSEQATKILKMDYAGVDIIPDQDGQLQILEVNSIPAWYGLQKTNKIDIAAKLIQLLIKHTDLAKHI